MKSYPLEAVFIGVDLKLYESIFIQSVVFVK